MTDALYAAVQDVASALDLTATATLMNAANAGDTVLQANQAVNIAPGALLLVGYKGQVSETTTVLSVSGDTIALQDPLSIAHGVGTILLEVTPFPDTVSAASRRVDELTFTPYNGWLDGPATETHRARTAKDGSVLLTLNKTPITAVTSITATSPLLGSKAYTIDPSSAFWDDGAYTVSIPVNQYMPIGAFDPVVVTISYEGGYSMTDMPGDLKRATAMLAARLWKEKDSGFSDIVGSAETGQYFYSKSAPPDVISMLKVRQRVIV